MATADLGHCDFLSDTSTTTTKRNSFPVTTTCLALIAFKVKSFQPILNCRKTDNSFLQSPATVPKSVAQSPFHLLLSHDIATIPKWMYDQHGGIPERLSQENRMATGAYYLRSGKSVPYKAFAVVEKGRSTHVTHQIWYKPICNSGKTESHLDEEMKMLFRLFQKLMRQHVSDVVTAYSVLLEVVPATLKGRTPTHYLLAMLASI